MTTNQTIEVVAHRGYTLHYPENTLVAMRAAVDAGARFVELDVQLTRDGVPVLFHDEDLFRLCSVHGLLQERTLAELAPLHAAEAGRFGHRFADEPIPTLQAFCSWLAQHARITAFVEIKPEAIVRHGQDATLRAILPAMTSVQRQCVIISFDHDFLVYIRKRQPQLAIGVVVERWEDLRGTTIDQLHAEFVFCDVMGLPPAGELLAPHNAHVAAYEVADIMQARGLAARGIRMIETFACGELLQQLAK